MSGAVSPPCLSRQTMVGVMVVMTASFQRTVAFRPHGRLLSTQASTGESWTLTGKPASVTRGVTSFFLGPGAYEVLFVPSKSLFPQSCGSSVIKSHWPPKPNSRGVLSPFAGSPGWGIWCGSWNFATVQELLWYVVLQFVGCVLGGSMVGLTCCASQVCCSQIPCPCGRPLLTHASAGDIQTLKAGLAQSLVGSLGPGAHKVLFESSKHLWRRWV